MITSIICANCAAEIHVDSATVSTRILIFHEEQQTLQFRCPACDVSYKLPVGVE